MSQITAERRTWTATLLAFPALANRLAGRESAVLAALQAEMLALVAAVCAVIVLVKGFIAFSDLANPEVPPNLFRDGPLVGLGRVGACCLEDFGAGAACMLAAMLGARLALPWRWARLALRLLAYGAAIGALVFLVINANLFHVLRHYLTYSVFRLGGGFQLERSIHAYITLPVKLALALVPTLTLALHLALHRRLRGFWQRAARRLCRPVSLVMVSLGLVVVAPLAQQAVLDGTATDFGHNPHLLFVRSLFWSGAFAVEDTSAADDVDFAAGRPGHTPDLLVKRPQNLIVITLESACASYFEAYGCRLPTTPCLNKLADRSLVFDNFYATANHSIASALPILSGLYNDPTTLATVIDYPDFKAPHAAQWLRGLGYRTYFLASGGEWAWEKYRNIVPAFCVDGFDVARDPAAPFWQGAARKGAPLDDHYLDADTFADARRALRAERDNKFALFIWAYETHAPYTEGEGPTNWNEAFFPAAVRGDAAREKEFRPFLRALWRIDRLIGELYAELEALGLAENTVIAVTGDHGEAFGEHTWFGHGWSVYEEEVRVPLILIGPRLAPLGQRSPVLGSHVDLWATLTDICGLAADPRWQGRSLVSGGAEDRRAYFYRLDAAIGMREGRCKYIWDFRSGRHLLFDIESDPLETLNLAPQFPERCAAGYRRVKAWTSCQVRLTKQLMER